MLIQKYTVPDFLGRETTDTIHQKIQDVLDNIKAKVGVGSTAIYNGKTFTAMVDANNADTGAQATPTIDAKNPSVVTSSQAYKMINQELKLASSVGATKTKATVGTDPTTATNGKVTFSINKGTVDRKEALTFSLHVGADTDMNNKISVEIDALDTAGLGVEGLNVKDSTGTSGTYAIDAIADAVAKVSATRSALGAVQNRLEHTINNLDNVVENTTAAESQIRDTDMATEMVKYSKNNILQQAGQSMLAQANQSNQGVLSLLG